MKKSIIIAALSAASAILLAASCQKQEEPEIKNESKTFTAVIDQELTKTTITSEYKVNWNEGDQIDINAGTTYSATPNTSDATKATFTKVSGSDPDGEYGYTAVYPASLFKDSGYELPAAQTHVAGKFNAPMCAMSSTETLEFKNFCGVLCFALKGTDKVKSIAVTANEQLCGPFEFIDATVFCFTGENEGYTVTLDCGTEGVQLNEATATNFYIYLPPYTYTAGMKMTVTNTEGETFEKTTTKDAGIARSNIYTFNWTPTFGPVLPAGALKGKFSVSATKQVYFSQGNLYWDGSTFEFETNQYDFPTTWSASHVNHFSWSKDASVSCAQSYSDSDARDDDVFFTNAEAATAKSDFTVNGVTGKYRTLSAAEWAYLFGTRPNATNLYKLGITVCGKEKCIIIAPDNWNLTANPLQSSYGTTSTEENPMTWEQAETAGLVCLPAAGYRENYTTIRYPGVKAYYWTSSAAGSLSAYYIGHSGNSSLALNSGDYRYANNSVRLVTDCE